MMSLTLKNKTTTKLQVLQGVMPQIQQVESMETINWLIGRNQAQSTTTTTGRQAHSQSTTGRMRRPNVPKSRPPSPPTSISASISPRSSKSKSSNLGRLESSQTSQITDRKEPDGDGGNTNTVHSTSKSSSSSSETLEIGSSIRFGESGKTYRVEKYLGKGDYGHVWKIRDPPTNQILQMKQQIQSRLVDGKILKYEYEIRKKLQVLKGPHDNIPSVLDYYYRMGREGQGEFFVQEFIEGDNLKSFFEKNILGKGYNRHPKYHLWVQSFLEEVIKVLFYQHQTQSEKQNIFHRDLQMENIMLSKKWELKQGREIPFYRQNCQDQDQAMEELLTIKPKVIDWGVQMEMEPQSKTNKYEMIPDSVQQGSDSDSKLKTFTMHGFRLYMANTHCLLNSAPENFSKDRHMVESGNRMEREKNIEFGTGWQKFYDEKNKDKIFFRNSQGEIYAFGHMLKLFLMPTPKDVKEYKIQIKRVKYKTTESMSRKKQNRYQKDLDLSQKLEGQCQSLRNKDQLIELQKISELCTEWNPEKRPSLDELKTKLNQFVKKQRSTYSSDDYGQDYGMDYEDNFKTDSSDNGYGLALDYGMDYGMDYDMDYDSSNFKTDSSDNYHTETDTSSTILRMSPSLFRNGFSPSLTMSSGNNSVEDPMQMLDFAQ